jgi:hypothetical protein
MEEDKKQITELEEELTFSNEEEVLPPSDIVAFNETRSCADLLRMFNNKQLEIQPDFQRNFIWEPSAQTRFIDSLIKQLPIPNLCIGLDYKTDKRIVIDGLQRISTIIRFLTEDKWRLSALPDVDKNISGKSVNEIKRSTTFFERVENFAISVIVLRYDFSKQTHKDYLFTIFHRLNTGGKKLNNQEIRNCIYSGTFNDLLKEVANDESWKEIFGDTQKTDRFYSEEILLRTFAFKDKLEKYTGNLAKFLNDYMSEKQNISEEEIVAYKSAILDTLSFIKDKIGCNQSIKEYGRTLKEGLLVGIISNIEKLKLKTEKQAKEMFSNFDNDTDFKEDNIKQGLSAKEKVQSRLRKSISIFGV